MKYFKVNRMVKEVHVKTILNKHKKRDDWFLDDYSINPYKLCQFNCVYCYIRGSKYGENMGKELAVKINAPKLLRKALERRARKKEYGIIAIATATEAWQPIEEKYEITRKCLQIIEQYRFPVHISTKSKLVTRDIDILKEINKKAILPQDLRGKLEHGVLITLSISTLDEKVSKIFEPGAPTPRERLETLQKIKEEGFKTGLAYIPILPYISDTEHQLEEMIRTAKEYNADYVFIGALTLYGAGKTLYYKILEKHYPELLPKYEKLFKGSFQPEKSYQNHLYKTAKTLTKKYKIRDRIY